VGFLGELTVLPGTKDPSEEEGDGKLELAPVPSPVRDTVSSPRAMVINKR
jgi:hypothetical protein